MKRLKSIQNLYQKIKEYPKYLINIFLQIVKKKHFPTSLHELLLLNSRLDLIQLIRIKKQY
jgi:hypothetical protein